MRAAPRLQTRSAQASPQNAQAPPRSDFSKKCLSSRSPERPGRGRGSLAEPRPPQVVSRDPASARPRRRHHPPPLRAVPRLRPHCPFPRTGPDRTGPSWAARARPLTMASLFKKKTVDGEFKARLHRPGRGSRAPARCCPLSPQPRGGPRSAAPQVTVAASLRLPPQPHLGGSSSRSRSPHPGFLSFSFFSTSPFRRDSEHSEEAEQDRPWGVVRLGDLMNFWVVSPAGVLLPSAETSHSLTSEREARVLSGGPGSG